jgi:hypothetical protein
MIPVAAGTPHGDVRRRLDRARRVCQAWGMKFTPLFAVILGGAVLAVSAEEYLVHTFQRTQLTDKFWGEGATFGDLNRDGIPDIISGPYWYAGPDFTKRHEFYPATATFKLKQADGTERTVEGFEGALGTQNKYSDNFLVFVMILTATSGVTFSSSVFRASGHRGMKIPRARRGIGRNMTCFIPPTMNRRCSRI